MIDTLHLDIVVVTQIPKYGHSARKCYHRFDLTYQHSSSPPNKQAFIAANNGGWENDWLADTGATHHITHDMANLNLKSDDYTGTDQLQLATVKVCISLKLAIPLFIHPLIPLY